MRVEANTAQYSQQIEQLKAAATEVLREVKTKPAAAPRPEVSTPRSLRPQSDPIDGKLSAQRSKLLNDVFKLADVSVKFDLPKSDFAAFLAQKADELNTLSQRMSVDNATFANEFSDGVNELHQQHLEDADNIADAKATFEEDDGNIRDSRANYEADAAEVQRFRQNFVQDAGSLEAFRKDFVEDKQNVRVFTDDFYEDRDNVRKFQWRFVEDSQNIVGSQRNFVEDRNNVQKFQDTFVEDKANNADARANYEAEARELNTQRQNYYEDARELARRQENFSEDNETMFQFSEKYDSEFRKINSFRAAYDREVDSINRLQSIADLQKAAVHESTLANASKQVEFPVASDIEGSFANEKPMPRVRNAVTITEIDLPNPASTASPDKPWLDSQNLSEATGGTPPLPGQSTPREFAVRPQVSSEPFQVNPQARLVNIVASELAPTKNPPVELEPKHQELAPKPTVPAFDDDSSVSPIQSRPAIAQPISAGQQHSHAEQDVFQIAILLAAQMGNAAPAQASVNRGEIAAMNAGLAGDLKSGFSFLSHTAKKDERRRHEDDDDEEERR